MSKWRALHKRISTSEKVNLLLPLAVPRRLMEFSQMLYTWMIPHCDNWGRIDATPFYVKHNVMPRSRRSLKDFALALRGQHDVGLITLYADDRNVPCLQVLQWDRLQPGLHKRTGRSDFPDPPKCVKRKDLRHIPGNSRVDLDIDIDIDVDRDVVVPSSSVSDMAFSSALTQALAKAKEQRLAGALLMRLPDEIERRLGHLDRRIQGGKNRRLYESWRRWAGRHKDPERITAVIRACITQTLMDARDRKGDGKPIIKTSVGAYFYGMVRSRLREMGWILPITKQTKRAVTGKDADSAGGR